MGVAPIPLVGISTQILPYVAILAGQIARYMGISPVGKYDRDFLRHLQRQDERQKITQEMEIPIHTLQDGEGNRQTIRDYEDSVCFACPCCVLWQVALQDMRDAIVAHSTMGHNRANREESCNVCQMAGGAYDAKKEG